MTLANEISEKIKADAEHYANVQIGDKGKFSDYAFLCKWQNAYDDYTAGATEWAGWFVKLKEREDSYRTALRNIIIWCEESGLKNIALDDKKGMAIYHSLHLAKNALADYRGKEGENGRK